MYAPDNGHQFYIHTFDNKLTPISDSSTIVKVSCAYLNGTHYPILRDHFKDYNRVTEVIITDGTLGPLNHPLHIFHYPSWSHKKFPINKAVESITKLYQSEIIWNGPVLVMRFENSGRNSYSREEIIQIEENAALCGYFLNPNSIKWTHTVKDVFIYPD